MEGTCIAGELYGPDGFAVVGAVKVSAGGKVFEVVCGDVGPPSVPESEGGMESGADSGGVCEYIPAPGVGGAGSFKGICCPGTAC